MAAKKNKKFVVIYESADVPAASNPKEPARRIHEVEAPNKEEAVEQARQADLRHSMRLLDEAKAADDTNRKADAKFLRARANIDSWTLSSAEEVK